MVVNFQLLAGLVMFIVCGYKLFTPVDYFEGIRFMAFTYLVGMLVSAILIATS